MAKKSEFWKLFLGREFGSPSTNEGALRHLADRLEERLCRLEHRYERQSLVSRALWELLEKKTGLNEDDLIAKVAEIDLRDGQLDHRLTPPLLDCPNCGDKVNARTRICIKCGFKDFPVDVFEVE